MYLIKCGISLSASDLLIFLNTTVGVRGDLFSLIRLIVWRSMITECTETITMYIKYGRMRSVRFLVLSALLKPNHTALLVISSVEEF